eukprot:10193886-Alexandrium_andersonii.AAC.1
MPALRWSLSMPLASAPALTSALLCPGAQSFWAAKSLIGVHRRPSSLEPCVLAQPRSPSRCGRTCLQRQRPPWPGRATSAGSRTTT